MAAIVFHHYLLLAFIPVIAVVLVSADPLPVRAEEGTPVPYVFSLQVERQDGEFIHVCTGIVIDSLTWQRTIADRNQSSVAITSRSCGERMEYTFSYVPFTPPKAVFADGTVLNIIDLQLIYTPSYDARFGLLLLEGSRPGGMILPANSDVPTRVFYSQLVQENDHISMRTVVTELSARQIQGGPTFWSMDGPNGVADKGMPMHFVNKNNDNVLVAIHEENLSYVNCRVISESVDRGLPITWRDMTTTTRNPWEFDGQCGVSPPSRTRMFSTSSDIPDAVRQIFSSHIRPSDEPLDAARSHPWLISVRKVYRSYHDAPTAVHIGAAVFVPARSNALRSDIAFTTMERCWEISNRRDSMVQYIAVFGPYDKDEAGEESVEIERCDDYRYGSNPFNAGIGLIKFREPKSFTEAARPPCVTNGIETGENNAAAMILSWSAVTTNNSSHQLRQIPVRIVEPERCGDDYNIDRLICIDAYGNNTVREYRNSDIGGPILKQDANGVVTVIGLVPTNSDRTARLPMPMLATRLSFYIGQKHFEREFKELSSLW